MPPEYRNLRLVVVYFLVLCAKQRPRKESRASYNYCRVLFIYLFTYLFIYLFIYLSIYLFTYLFIYLFIYFSSIFIYCTFKLRYAT